MVGRYFVPATTKPHARVSRGPTSSAYPDFLRKRMGQTKSLFWKKRPKRIPPNQRRRLHAAGLRHGCGHLCCPPLLLSALISAHLLRHSHDRTSPSLHRLALFSSPLLLFSSRGLLLSAAFLAATGCSFDWWLPRPWPSRLSRCRSSRSLRSSLHCRSSLPSLPRFCMLHLLSHVRCIR